MPKRTLYALLVLPLVLMCSFALAEGKRPPAGFVKPPIFRRRTERPR